MNSSFQHFVDVKCGAGEIPASLGQLTRLTSLSFTGNRLNGKIEVDLRSLKPVSDSE